MNPETLFEAYLDQRHKMQLATVSGDQPWICTVYYVHDDDYNLYWASLPSRQHSQEIAENPKIAAAIVVKGVIGEKVIGIQMQGTAEQLEPSPEIRAIAEKYAQKFKRDEQWIEDFTAGETEHRLYKLTPASIVIFDEHNFPDDPQQKIR